MPSLQRPLVPFAAVVGLVIASCGEPAGPSDVAGRMPAIVEHYGTVATLSVPSATEPDGTAVVEFTTFEGGCIGSAPVQVSVRGRQAVIRPYQAGYRPSPDAVCAEVLRVARHLVTLRFSQAGPSQVRLVGRKEPGGATVVLARPIQVVVR